jgi:hypothetical protein
MASFAGSSSTLGSDVLDVATYIVVGIGVWTNVKR